MLNWFPDMDTGTASGQSQGPWAVTGNNSYVVMVGEFKNVNQRAQQGLSRFAVRSIAPNDQAPRVSGASFVPSLSSPGAGQVRVQWQANWDRDNSNLTYSVLRDGGTTPVYTASQLSTFWQRPTMTFTDSGLTGGQHTYRISVRDPLGNTLTGNTATITVAGATNGPPTANFASSTNGLTVSVNGSASADPGGSITGYAWQFGDGGTASGVSTQHTYAAAGTYPVTLVVTDNSGNTDSASAQVTVSEGQDPGGPLAADAFGRTVASGWGTADVGGPWSVSGGATPFSVSGGSARITLEPGKGPSAYLGSVSATDTDTAVKLSFDKVPNGGGAYAGIVGRRVGSAEYRAKVKVDAAGAVSLRLFRLSGGVETTQQYVTASSPGRGTADCLIAARRAKAMAESRTVAPTAGTCRGRERRRRRPRGGRWAPGCEQLPLPFRLQARAVGRLGLLQRLAYSVVERPEVKPGCACPGHVCPVHPDPVGSWSQSGTSIHSPIPARPASRRRSRPDRPWLRSPAGRLDELGPGPPGMRAL